MNESRATVLLSEGIEDGFAIKAAMASDKSAVWAAPTASFLHLVEFPDLVRRVVICSDNDGAGRTAAEKLKSRLLSEGRRVRLYLPPREGADWSDILSKSENAG